MQGTRLTGSMRWSCWRWLSLPLPECSPGSCSRMWQGRCCFSSLCTGNTRSLRSRSPPPRSRRDILETSVKSVSQGCQWQATSPPFYTVEHMLASKAASTSLCCLALCVQTPKCLAVRLMFFNEHSQLFNTFTSLHIFLITSVKYLECIEWGLDVVPLCIAGFRPKKIYLSDR